MTDKFDEFFLSDVYEAWQKSFCDIINYMVNRINGNMTDKDQR